MTNHDSALNALSESLGATDSPLAANLAEILTDAIQSLIEADLSARIGAEPNERSMARSNLRNGHRDKLVSTPAGDITVGIPKLRKGSFFPELLEPRRRIDKALWAVIMTAYITGTSTRKSTTSSKHSAATLAFRSRRCRGSANTSTLTLQCSGTVIWAIRRSSTSGWTPPTSMSARAARSSPKLL